MNRSLPCLTTALAALLTACQPSPPRQAAAGFREARQVLETHCVHCHGDNRLSHMPPIHSTTALQRLIGPDNWIAPGHPERSRFFQVVTFADNIPGAMPPTGHAIPRRDVEILRAWIAAGAPVPAGPETPLHPQGRRPRSE
jgi:mono/diheme cytochrome c family protein